jgi:hypothetical protein
MNHTVFFQALFRIHRLRSVRVWQTGAKPSISGKLGPQKHIRLDQRECPLATFTGDRDLGEGQLITNCINQSPHPEVKKTTCAIFLPDSLWT